MPAWMLWGVLAVNLVTFLMFGIDKWKSRANSWRIPEAHLLLLMAFTGAVGGWLGSSVFRHKTRKTSFRVKMVLATLVNGAWVYLWWKMRE